MMTTPDKKYNHDSHALFHVHVARVHTLSAGVT